MVKQNRGKIVKHRVEMMKQKRGKITVEMVAKQSSLHSR